MKTINIIRNNTTMMLVIGKTSEIQSTYKAIIRNLKKCTKNPSCNSCNLYPLYIQDPNFVHSKDMYGLLIDKDTKLFHVINSDTALSFIYDCI